MERIERVKRYVEILSKNNLSNAMINWNELDKLSDEELFDEVKIMECIKNIKLLSNQEASQSNEYPEQIMRCVRQNLGLDKFDCSKDEIINQMSKDEVFERVCAWNGLINYSFTIKKWINSIYGIHF